MTRGATSPAASAGFEIRARATDPVAWDDFVRTHPGATLFHRSAWQTAVADAFGYVDRSVAVWRDGAIRGILPLTQVPTLPWGRSLVSTAQAVYGGPVAEDAAASDALLAHALAEGTRLGARYVEYRNRAAVGDLPSRDLYVTFRKPILPTAEENMAAIPRNQRRSIRIGLKSGLDAVHGGAELLDDFYRIYATSVRNLGTPVFPRRLFANLMAAFPAEAGILVVRREGVPLASVLTFYDRGEVSPYYGGSLREGWRYGVNDYMYWSLMIHGMERGDTLFDFGRSKRGSGSFDFKRHWGFEPTPLAYQYALVRQKELPDLSPKNPKFSLAIDLWKRMPLALATRVGPMLVRYFP
ncbi:MAG TPA: FemAB family XrtA/PEP-CTERM system-associated protein [Candidatus Eisenbacteria bacterium]|nr:FemAB family XrtA/PEP-CTERM system-associated protein [Candidatus Eisenbacteria bacterium]